MITLEVGDLCYFETVRDGLIPCRFIGVAENDVTQHALPKALILQVTGSRVGYRRGETIRTSALHAIPRDAVMRRRFKTVILPYEVVG